MLKRPLAGRQLPLEGSTDGLLVLPSALHRCFALSENWTTCSDSVLEGNV